jgi:hypothetical protein
MSKTWLDQNLEATERLGGLISRCGELGVCRHGGQRDKTNDGDKQTLGAHKTILLLLI